MPTLNWTGQRSISGSLLDLRFNNKANVMHDGKLVGYVFALPNGYYLPKIEGMQDSECATPDQAARKVVEMHQEFRS